MKEVVPPGACQDACGLPAATTQAAETSGVGEAESVRRLVGVVGSAMAHNFSSTPCHSCGAPLGLELAIQPVAGHTMRYTVHPLTAGVGMTARAIGGQLTALAKLNEEIAKTMGLKVQTVVTDIGMGEDGQIVFTLLMAPLAGERAARARQLDASLSGAAPAGAHTNGNSGRNK